MPFSQTSTLAFSLPVAGPVSLVIHDLAGRRVQTLLRGSFAAGRDTRTWDGRNEAGHPVPSGLYLAHLQTRDARKTHKLLLVR